MPNYNNVYGLFLLLTFTINIIMLATWEANPDPSVILPIVPSWYPTTIIALGVVHIVLSVVVVMQYVLNEPFPGFIPITTLGDLKHYIPTFEVRGQAERRWRDRGNDG